MILDVHRVASVGMALGLDVGCLSTLRRLHKYIYIYICTVQLPESPAQYIILELFRRLTLLYWFATILINAPLSVIYPNLPSQASYIRWGCDSRPSNCNHR